MQRRQSFQYERSSAIAANYYHIMRQLKNDGDHRQDNHQFILKASSWNYQTFGYGQVSLDGYLEHLKIKMTSRLYNTDVKLWYEIINNVFKRDNYTCQYCGNIGGKLECDHMQPISRGGTNDYYNLTTACRKCNRQKKNKTVAEFIQWRLSK